MRRESSGREGAIGSNNEVRGDNFARVAETGRSESEMEELCVEIEVFHPNAMCASFLVMLLQ
jgi:hypothetical protein